MPSAASWKARPGAFENAGRRRSYRCGHSADTILQGGAKPATLSPARALGATGVTVPVIGDGTTPLGHHDIPPGQGVRCIHHMLDQGITYLDTSPDDGSEPVVGEVMPDVLRAALERCRFDTALVAMGMGDHLVRK